MAITSINQNSNTTYSSYLKKSGQINTTDNVKPLPAQGHLVHDTLLNIPKFWIKDIAYDLKAVKDGFKGVANDHQLGRINDVGLKFGGIGIAAYLASKTSDPKTRIMEYVGLGTFLAAMSIYPKLAINAPSEAVHGFDIGKKYIDDQGRKKSVFQDSNYIPFDMYRGEYLDEDLDVIGNRMGIPNDIVNRHALIKEQMRKIATQNNTLWMLSAGFATPVMTALICCGLEKLIAPAVERARNSKANSEITRLLEMTKSMSDDIESIQGNDLSKKVENILLKYKDSSITQDEIDKIVSLLSDETDAKLAESIKNDISNIFRTQKFGYLLPEDITADILISAKASVPKFRNTETMARILTPEYADVDSVIHSVVGDSTEITQDELRSLREKLNQLFIQRIDNDNLIKNKDFYKNEVREIVEKITGNLKETYATEVTAETINEAVNFAKVIGEFKDNDRLLKKCQGVKAEYASDTTLARYYSKFENTLLDVLGIKYKDLKVIRESETLTKDLLDKKLSELCNNGDKYNKAVKKLANIIEEMEAGLNGNVANQSSLLDLVNAVENNYNNTAKRLNNLNGNKFSNVIKQLVAEDTSTLSNKVTTRQELIALLDGTTEYTKANDIPVKNVSGVGSSKDMMITRLIERYQGVKNSFFRILHTMDVYKREIPEDRYGKLLLDKGKSVILTADSSQHTQKLGTPNNPLFYKDLMENLYGGKVEDATKEAMNGTKKALESNLFERFSGYLKRFRDIMGNNTIDFKNPNHILDDASKNYVQDAQTRMSKFNLVSQTPVDLVKNASARRYGNQKWLRMAAAIGGAVLGTVLLAQFSFGKLNNPQNVKKKVNNA